MTYSKKVDESERVQFLRSLHILDTAPDIHLDRVVTLCRNIFDVPMADISLIDEDRQWFKSMQGFEVEETKRKDSFCSVTIETDGILEIPNTTEHPQFKSNPYVLGEPNIRYYMGAPITISGFRIGALCILDSEPRSPASPKSREILLDLAAIVSREIYLKHLLREAIPSIIFSANTSSTATGTGTVVSEGSGTTTTTGVGTTTTTGTGTTTTTGTGTVTSTGAGTTTTTGTGITTTTGTGTTTREGEGTTTSKTPGLEVTTTEAAETTPKPPKKNSKKKD